MNQPNYAEQVLQKHFGAQIKESIQELLNYKLTIIRSIMGKRHLLGYGFDSVIFDKLYDSDVDVLELYDMQYEEQCIRYTDRRKHA